jgi:signal transduction histidine kinase
VTTSLYRILLETLSNVQRHSQAADVVIELAGHVGWLTLSVSDNGTGFSLGTKDHGLGFVSMRERAYMLNGTFTVESRLGVGTTVKVQVPLS